MLKAYIQAAMNRAHYEIIEDESPIYGEIPVCRGVWAVGKTLEDCRDELESSLESWIVFRLYDGLPLPEIDNIRWIEKR